MRRYPLHNSPQSILTPIKKNDPEPTFSIDIVYTWVNANDSEFLKILTQHLQEEETNKQSDSYAQIRQSHSLHEARWRSLDELKYSLRSIEQYAPWVNRIYIVTNGQVLPSWLDITHPKIKIITHDQIIDPQYLPTFNSHVIESCLHRIPDLSEHYIYLNDDMMFVRPVRKAEFFSADGKMIARVTRIIHNDPLTNNIPITDEHNPHVWAKKNAQKLIFNTHDVFFDRNFAHYAYVQLKSIAALCEQKYAEVYATFRPNKFRDKNDILCCSFLYPCEAYLQGKAVFALGSGIFIKATEKSALALYQRILKAAGREKRMCICINDGYYDNPLENYEKHYWKFIEARYPQPSSFEKKI